MNYVDIGMFVILILGMFIGWKRGVIKSLVKLVGIIVVAILAFTFKDALANWLIGFMPFYDFSGTFLGVKACNILLYQAMSFIVIFVILYCVLNIIVSVAGIIDKLLKASIIFALPDKILGAMVGFIEGLVFVFLILFVLSQIPLTQKYVMESKYGDRVLNRTPIVRTVLAKSTNVAEEFYQLSDKYQNSEDKTQFNIEAVNTLIKYGIITKQQAQDLVNNGKLGIQNVKFDSM